MYKPLVKSMGAPLAILATAGFVVGCNSSSDSSSVGGTAATCSAASSSAAAAPAATIKAPAEGVEAFMQAPSGKSLKKLHGHIPPVVKTFSDAGRVSEDQQMPITIALPLNNESDLQQKLAAMYQPGNPNYHKFMTPQEFRQNYAPTQAQIAQVQSLLKSNGISNSTVDGSQLQVHAQATVAQVNTLFNTEIHQYKSGSTTYYSPAYELQVPSDAPIQAVVGLQNVTKAHTHLHQLTTVNAGPKTGTGPNGGLSPADIHNAYGISTSTTGSGETMALFELDGYAASDITSYESNFSLPNVPLQNVLVNGATGSAGGGADEVTLDIELMIAMAPGASKVLVYEGTNDDQGILATYTKIATDNLAREVSTSWGTSEDGTDSSLVQSENTVFEQMASQGQSIYAAAGDSGADDNGSSLSVDDPSSQPYMVAVGGTSLTTTSSGGYQSESSWDDSSSSAGGGGISTIWSIPSWQSGVANSSNKGSTTMRNTPDVSLEADPNNGYAIYYSGSWTIFGGTSCAAPLWAGFTALVNQQRIAGGQKALGFADPALYAIGNGGDYGTDFNDIADDSNNGYYPAVKGYDNSTGWGTIKGAGLMKDLVAEPASCGT
jgi:kumamolisin